MPQFFEMPFPVFYELSDRRNFSAILHVQDLLRRFGKERDVKLSTLTSIQYYLNPQELDYKLRHPDTDPILVGKINGMNLILDGSHRAAVAWSQGKTSIRARFLDFGKLKTKNVDNDYLVKKFDAARPKGR